MLVIVIPEESVFEATRNLEAGDDNSGSHIPDEKREQFLKTVVACVIHRVHEIDGIATAPEEQAPRHFIRDVGNRGAFWEAERYELEALGGADADEEIRKAPPSNPTV